MTIPGVDDAKAQELVEAAHQVCPYSKATRGNVPVTVSARAPDPHDRTHSRCLADLARAAALRGGGSCRLPVVPGWRGGAG